jgi:hypothetical protein
MRQFDDLRLHLDGKNPDGSWATTAQVREARLRMDRLAVVHQQLSPEAFEAEWGVQAWCVPIPQYEPENGPAESTGGEHDE